MKPIHINFKPSKLLSALIIGASLGASCILLLVDLTWLVKLISVLTILVVAVYYVLFRALLLLPSSYLVLDVDIKNQLKLTRKDGAHLQVSVLADSVVTPYLTILHFSCEGATFLGRLFGQHLIILPDALDVESYRQLRVWLRWGHHSAIAKSQS
ncbi:MAG TPA: protein YgfX [Methylotenera sp.]|nr:protein YgfX [Methylotenera sp.]